MALVETVYIQSGSPSKQLYYDPAGRQSYGYIKDGYVYKDRDFTERIDVGSIVPMANGTFIRTEQGSMKLGDFLAQAGGKAQSAPLGTYGEALKSAAAGRTEAEIGALEAQKPKVEARFSDIATQAYRAHRGGEKALADSLASGGLYNSGYSDTLKVAREAAYGENLNSASLARAQALSELDAEISKQRQLGAASLSELEAELAKLASAREDSEKKLAEERYWKQLSYDAGRDDESWARAYRQERDEVEDAAARAALDFKYAQEEAKKKTGSAAPSSKAKEKEPGLTSLQKAELERDAAALAGSFYKSGDQYSKFMSYLGGEGAKSIYEKLYGPAGYDFLVDSALEAYDRLRAGAAKAQSAGGISLSPAQAQSLAKSLREQARAGGLSEAQVKKKLDEAGFDSDTRVLIELFYSAA